MLTWILLFCYILLVCLYDHHDVLEEDHQKEEDADDADDADGADGADYD